MLRNTSTFRLLRRPFAPLLALALVFVLAPAGEAATSVSFLRGKVSRQRPGGVWEPVELGAVVNPGDVLSTAGGGRATLSFDDGTRVDLDANSTLTVKDARDERSSLELAVGRLRAWVTKARSRRFDVKTPTAVCSVRGTEFEVSVGGGGRTNVQMFEGLLAVSDQRGNETLLRDNQSITVTDQGLGAVRGDRADAQASDRERAALRREVGLEMTKEEVQAAAALEAKNSVYQQGKAIIDVHGNRVRIEEYIIRPADNQFKLVVLNDRVDRFDYFYYKGTFNTTLPDDLSIALRQLPGCIGAMCTYFLTGYETARSNTIDNMTEITSGGHQVDVNSLLNGPTSDDVTAAYDPTTDNFVSIDPNTTPFFQTLFNNYSLTFNGVVHQSWASAVNITTLDSGGAGTLPTFNNVTTVRYDPACAPPDCTYNEFAEGVMHDVVYASDNSGAIWEKYESYIISDEGRIARTSDFAGITTGASYKDVLLNWNFQTIVTASEFGGRKIDLAVEPKIFIQSGLIP